MTVCDGSDRLGGNVRQGETHRLPALSRGSYKGPVMARYNDGRQEGGQGQARGLCCIIATVTGTICLFVLTSDLLLLLPLPNQPFE